MHTRQSPTTPPPLHSFSNPEESLGFHNNPEIAAVLLDTYVLVSLLILGSQKRTMRATEPPVLLKKGILNVSLTEICPRPPDENQNSNRANTI